MAMTVYLWHLSLLVVAFFALISAGVDLPAAGSGLWWLTRGFWLLGLALVLSVVATLLSPLERGRPAKATGAVGKPHVIPAKEPAPPMTPSAVLQRVGSSIGAALSSFGLLGYVASGLQPALHGSSTLLFVKVDPIQNTVCVFAGFALSYLATRWSLRQPGDQEVRPAQHTDGPAIAAGQDRVPALQDATVPAYVRTRTRQRGRQAHALPDRVGKVRGTRNKRPRAKEPR